MARWFGVKANELTLTNGADGALQQIVTTFVDRRSAILLVDPTFVDVSLLRTAFRRANYFSPIRFRNEVSRGLRDENAAKISALIPDRKSK